MLRASSRASLHEEDDDDAACETTRLVDDDDDDVEPPKAASDGLNGEPAKAAPPSPWLLWSVVALVQLIFSGFAFLLHEFVDRDEALAFTCAREIAAAALLLIVARGTRPGFAWLPQESDAPVVVGLGAIEAIVFVCVATALALVSPFNVAVLSPSIPVFAATLAVGVGQELATWPKAAGLGLAIGGALVVVFSAPHAALGDHALGNALILFQCVCQAVYLVAQKKVVFKYPPVWVVAWTYASGAVWLAGGTAVFGRAGALELGRGGNRAGLWITFVYAVVLTGAVNFTALAWANRHVPASTLAASVTLQPVFTAVLRFAIYRLPIVLGQALGGCLIVAGLAVASLEDRHLNEVSAALESAYCGAPAFTQVPSDDARDGEATS